MNKWHCPYCQEELLGSVNRCWKCSGRVTPPNFDQLVTAEEVAEPREEDGVLVATAAEQPEVLRLTHDDVSLAIGKEPPRRGSPFAFNTTLSPRAPQDPFIGVGPYQRESKGPPVDAFPRPALATNYPRNQAAIGGVVASLVLGLVSLFILPFTIFGFVTAALGVFCGIWGLYCERKGLAIIALLLCCLALAIALYMVGFILYEWLNPGGITTPAGGLGP